jgi:SAM-dependent methyltransferase
MSHGVPGERTRLGFARAIRIVDCRFTDVGALGVYDSWLDESCLAPRKLSCVKTTIMAENYALGHSPAEIRRLVSQAAMLRPITKRLLQSFGISPGMRILDVGCGAGDVTMLAAELVGESGVVLGIDRSEAAVAASRARAAAARNVQFRVASPNDRLDEEPFDVVIARYVLMYQDDPVSLVRAAAGLAKPGGVVAFHEVDLADDFAALPAVSIWSQANAWLMSAFRSLLPNPDVPGRLVECFSQAGLGVPTLFCEVPIGDGERSPIPTWLVEALRTLLPQIVQRGWASEDAVDIDSLEKRLRAATIAARSQLSGLRQVCAWVRTPS